MKRIGMVSMAALLVAGATAVSADELSVVCSAEQDWCDLMAAAFEEENPDTDVLMVRK
jgi:iron(III) transport system substrate-binding protein